MDFEDGIRALDLFDGTGSISIELVSRGCDQVISVEKDRDHYALSLIHICSIARKYGVTVNQLKSWNGLRSTRISAGKRLKIYK